MTLKILLTVASVLGFVFGLAFLLFPFETTALYGYTLTAETSYIPRFFGAALLGFGVLDWLAKDLVGEGVGLRAIILGNLTNAVIGLAVALLNAFNLRGTGLIWSSVVIYALLVVGFAYFQFAKRGVTTTPTQLGTPGRPIPH